MFKKHTHLGPDRGPKLILNTMSFENFTYFFCFIPETRFVPKNQLFKINGHFQKENEEKIDLVSAPFQAHILCFGLRTQPAN